MTCSSCGAADAADVRDSVVYCSPCAERRDWEQIITIVQGGIPGPADFVEHLDRLPQEPVVSEVAADPFA